MQAPYLFDSRVTALTGVAYVLPLADPRELMGNPLEMMGTSGRAGKFRGGPGNAGAATCTVPQVRGRTSPRVADASGNRGRVGLEPSHDLLQGALDEVEKRVVRRSVRQEPIHCRQ